MQAAAAAAAAAAGGWASTCATASVNVVCHTLLLPRGMLTLNWCALKLGKWAGVSKRARNGSLLWHNVVLVLL
jgi:hypothetical protein